VSNRLKAVLSNDPNEPPIMREPELTTFISLVQAAKLDTFFHGTGPFTSFLPSNTAFENFDQSKLEELKEPQHMDELIDLINYHVILGKYLSKNLKSCTKRTVNGKNIDIQVEGDQITVNGAKVTKKDIVGPNGVTYIIDKVLVP